MPPEHDVLSILDSHDELLQDDVIATEEELRLAGDFISSFIKAVKAIRFYPTDNPLVKSFLGDFVTTCRQFLTDYDIFVLQIGETTFSYDDRVVYANTDWKSSLPFYLYNDGLRELRFHAGIEDWEIHGLLELVSRSFDLNPEEDDLVIMLWEQDFVHVDYLAIDDLQDDTATLIPDSVDQFRQHLVFSRLSEGDDSDMQPDLPAAAPAATPSSLTGYDPKLYTLTPDEQEQLRADVQAEIAPTFVFETTDLLFEVICLAREPDARHMAATVLVRVLDAMLTLGDFSRADQLLARAQALRAEMPDGASPLQETLDYLFSEASAAARIERIGRLLLRANHEMQASAQRYLLRLTPQAIPPLVRLLEDAKDTYLRRMLCDVLVELGRIDIQALYPFLDDTRWYVIRNIAFILGHIGDPATLPRLVPLLSHAEPRVRQEAAQALGHLRDMRAVIALGHALDDADEVTRSIAAFSLGKIGTPNALAHLLQVMQSKQFRKKSPTEMQAFFDGLALGSSNTAVPVLAQLLRFRTLFGGEKVDIIHRGAACTLARIGTPEALAALDTGRTTNDASIRHACEAALQQPSQTNRDTDHGH